MSLYETDKLLAEYLLFHYGKNEEVLPYSFGPQAALGYPARCAALCGDGERALDLGCAVGRSSFELARRFRDVIGIDYSERFIKAAQLLGAAGELAYGRLEEGEFFTPSVARVPEDIDRERVRFERGDAMALRADLGTFDSVLLANLIDRLRSPEACLARMGDIVRLGGRLVITSPSTWLEEFTPRSEWLCGKGQPTLDGLKAALDPAFELVSVHDLPFLIREHARKFQWSVAQASIWLRRS